MADLERIVDELERSYSELQERISDPAVYNDHREAAQVGRRLKELETPHRLAQEWRSTRDDLDDARGDGDLRELVPDLERRLAELEDELKLALVEHDPAATRRRSGRPRSAGCCSATPSAAASGPRRSPRARARPAASRRRRSRSRATAPTRSSSTRAARIASSACRRRSRRDASSRRRRPSQ